MPWSRNNAASIRVENRRKDSGLATLQKEKKVTTARPPKSAPSSKTRQSRNADSCCCGFRRVMRILVRWGKGKLQSDEQKEVETVLVLFDEGHTFLSS